MPKSFLHSYWKSILLCVVIFILSSVTFKTIPDVAQFRESDKVTHSLMYAGLGFIAYYEYIKDTVFRVKYPRLFLYFFVIFVIYGGLIEILQATLFRPRSAEFLDWIADIVGLTAGALAGKLLFKNFRNKE